ncbi:hypothetical protein [Candidatus Methanoplasma termitum]|nr:hypothetical protein [Candidatus Methanoplasma termitum]
MFFTDESVTELARYIGGEYPNYDYKGMVFSQPGLIEPVEIIPGMIQHGLALWADVLRIFDLAKEYYEKNKGQFIVVEIWLGYPIPPHTLMHETTIDLKDHVSGKWPKPLIDTLPDEKLLKDYRLEKGAEDFFGYTPTKTNPYFEWFTKYRLIDSGIK